MHRIYSNYTDEEFNTIEEEANKAGMTISAFCKAAVIAKVSGKTTFIKRRYENHEGVSCLNVWDYQDRAYREAGYLESIPFGASFRCLMKANSELLQDVIEKLKDGDVVIEQTFFKAKRSML